MRRGLLLAIVGVLIAAPAAAQAAGPTAIGVDSDGTAYVGFASGGAIKKYDGPNGTSLTGFNLVGGGSVAAIDVAPGTSSDVYVLKTVGTTSTIQRYTRSGTLVSSTNLAACGAGITPSPTTRGGLDVSNNRIYVAHPCDDKVQILDLSYNVLQTATVSGPKGVSAQLYDTAPGSTIALYVAQPALKRVIKLDRTTLGVQGVQNIPYGSPDDTVTDVFVDAFGVLDVLETTEDKLHMYDSNQSEFRWLGSTGTSAGRLNDPMAFDVFEQYSDYAGNVWFADYGNKRIQRMNSYGYTFWTAPADDATVAGPVNTARPTISGTPQQGQSVSCSQGSWTGSPTSYSYTWNRNGTPVATGSSYTIQAADVGQSLTCTVAATNAGGTGTATSDPVTPSAAPSAPTNNTRPAISGTAQTGQTLVCSQGTWNGSPTSYAYQWNRDGSAIGGANSANYTVVAADVGHALTCTVTATNGAGSASATSDPVTPTASVPASGPIGVSINGGADFTNSPSVTLTIHEPAAATSVLISNDGGFASPSTRAISGTDTYSWTLVNLKAERLPKTVYVRFAGGGVDTDKTYTDDIVLDTAPPAVTSATIGSPAAVSAAGAGKVLRVKAADKGASGLGRLQYARDRTGKKVKSVKFKRSVKVSSTAAARWVRVVDRAGNYSRWRKVTRR